MSQYKVSRERVKELLTKHGYSPTGLLEDGVWEEFARSANGKTTYISVGTSHLDADSYPICYDFRFTGCDRGVEAFIIGTYED